MGDPIFQDRQKRELRRRDSLPLGKDGETAPIHTADFKRGQAAVKADDILIPQLLNGLGCQKGYSLFGSAFTGMSALPDGMGMGKA